MSRRLEMWYTENSHSYKCTTQLPRECAGKPISKMRWMEQF